MQQWQVNNRNRQFLRYLIEKRKKIQRNGASTNTENSRQVDKLKDEIAYRRVDRLL